MGQGGDANAEPERVGAALAPGAGANGRAQPPAACIAAPLTTATRAWRRASVRRPRAWRSAPWVEPPCGPLARAARGRNRGPRRARLETLLLLPATTVWAERATVVAAISISLRRSVVANVPRRGQAAVATTTMCR